MLGCSEQRLSEYIDGDLSPAGARELEHHLRSCPKCREVLLDLRALVAIVHLIGPRPSYPSGLQPDNTALGDTFGWGPGGRIAS